MTRQLPKTAAEARVMWPGAVDAIKRQTLEIMAENECFAPWGLVTVRFQAMWIEILTLRERLAKEPETEPRWTAPQPRTGETNGAYLTRVVGDMEEFVNRKLAKS